MYEHEASSSSCGLVDVLLPADETRDTADGWSSGRRRCASWLAQPCATDADCRLLVTGAVQCGQQEAGSPPSTCSCRPGWRPAGPLACQRHGGRWVALTSTLLAGQPRRRHQQPTLGECQQACARSVECWALQFSEGECRQYDTAEQSPAPQPPPPQVTGYVWQFDREDGSPPAGYTELNGTWLQLTSHMPSTHAAMACLKLGGIRYVPADPEELKTTFDFFASQGVSRFAIGINDILEEGSFITIDGDVLTSRSWWAASQPNNMYGAEDCAATGYGDGALLHDINCDQQAWQMWRVCRRGSAVGCGRAGSSSSRRRTRPPPPPPPSGGRTTSARCSRSAGCCTWPTGGPPRRRSSGPSCGWAPHRPTPPRPPSVTGSRARSWRSASADGSRATCRWPAAICTWGRRTARARSCGRRSPRSETGTTTSESNFLISCLLC